MPSPHFTDEKTCAQNIERFVQAHTTSQYLFFISSQQKQKGIDFIIINNRFVYAFFSENQTHSYARALFQCGFISKTHFSFCIFENRGEAICSRYAANTWQNHLHYNKTQLSGDKILCYAFRNLEIYKNKAIYTTMFITTIFIVVKFEQKSQHPTIERWLNKSGIIHKIEHYTTIIS